MIKRLIILFCFPFTALVAQTGTTDTARAEVLEEVVVKGYEQNRVLREVAAPVTIISQQQLQRFGPGSILPAVNATPGVRMEERSPGSYRLNIRGSSLRSPFGVRNVKIYWNDIPFTDPGGNTYLNQFSFYNISGMEILKGPGSSLYGAGTGGVILLNSFPNSISNGLSVNYAGGSYASTNLNVSLVAGEDRFRNMIAYTRQQSDGYRQQSAMRRDIVTWESRSSGEKHSLSSQVIFGDLFYETPGALTRTQYLADPKAARPAAGGFPGAVQNKAAIYQKTFWAGIRHQYQFNDRWQNSSSVYGAFSQIRNPAIRNYEKRLEPHFGGRTSFSYTTRIRRTALKILAGAELQQGYSNIKVYRNRQGNIDTLQTDDEVDIRQSGIFAQAEIVLPGGWIATGGMSVNRSGVRFDRLSDSPPFEFNADFNNEIAPRFSLLKKLTEQVSVYGLVSKGFSPPTVAELLPSTSIINTGLQAERGMNYEWGVRGNLFKNRLSIDVNAFYFRLQDAITQRRDLSGADYFVNAGRTKQQGVETALSWSVSKNTGRFISQLTVWLNHTFHYFRYTDFKQLSSDFSGKKIPSVAPQIVATGLDLVTKPGLYVNLTYYYSDPIALNDANAEYASSYNLPGFKAGWKRSFGEHVKTELFISGDNLFNQTYSLGNDINAAANRFYNAAAGVNYQAGVGVQYVF